MWCACLHHRVRIITLLWYLLPTPPQKEEGHGYCAPNDVQTTSCDHDGVGNFDGAAGRVGNDNNRDDDDNCNDYNNYDDYEDGRHCSGGSGRGTRRTWVQMLESNIPALSALDPLDMSTAQRDFISHHYYSTGGGDDNGDVLGGGRRVRNKGNVREEEAEEDNNGFLSSGRGKR
jgi:hypothetical protein